MAVSQRRQINATIRIASILGLYRQSSGTTPPPSSGRVKWNNASQTSATSLYIHDTTTDSVNIDYFLSLLQSGSSLVIQDKDDHLNFQVWEISGSPVDNTTFWEFPVTLVSSGGTGTTGFPNNHEIFVATLGAGGGVSDHGALTGLSDDDHPQYHNDARGDVRYYTKSQVDAKIAAIEDAVAYTQFGGF